MLKKIQTLLLEESGEMESQECSPIGVCVFTPNASGPSDDVDDDNNSVMCLVVSVS